MGRPKSLIKRAYVTTYIDSDLKDHLNNLANDISSKQDDPFSVSTMIRELLISTFPIPKKGKAVSNPNQMELLDGTN